MKKRLFNGHLSTYNESDLPISDSVRSDLRKIFEKHKDINPVDLLTLINFEAMDIYHEVIIMNREKNPIP